MKRLAEPSSERTVGVGMRRSGLQALNIAVVDPVRPFAVVIDIQTTPSAGLRRDRGSELALPGIGVGDTQFTRRHQVAKPADVNILGHRTAGVSTDDSLVVRSAMLTVINFCVPSALLTVSVSVTLSPFLSA